MSFYGQYSGIFGNSGGGGGGGGGVSSVGMTVPTFLSIAGSPITTSGTLAVSLSGTALPTTSGGTGLTTLGTNGQLLTMVSGAPAWASPATSGTVTSVAMTVPSFLSIAGSPITGSGTLAVTLSGTALPILNGGTGQTTALAAFNALSPMTTAGDTLYGGVSGSATRLGIGSTGNVLTVVAGVPAWVAPATSGTVTTVSVVSANGFTGSVATATTTPAITLTTSITGLLKGNGTAISAATSGTDYAPATSGSSILYGNGAGGFSSVTVGTGLSFSGGNLTNALSGTVTSVAMTVPSFLSISGSPITGSGTLAVSLSGTALPVANGGTGDTSLTAYALLAGGTTTTGALQQVSGVGTTGQILTSNGASALPTWQTSTVKPVYQAQYINGPGATDSNTQLLLTFDSGTTIIDYGFNALASGSWTLGGSATVDATHVKFGAGALDLDGGTAGGNYYLNFAGNAAFALGAGNFTIDFWWYYTGSPITTNLAGIYGTTANAWTIHVNSSGTFGFGNPSVGFPIAGGSAPGASAWHHIAVVRVGTTVTCYVDGTSIGTGTDATNYNNVSNVFRIGANPEWTAFADGWIDEFRISNIARWTANFTPPTSAYAIGQVIYDPNSLISSVTVNSTGNATVAFNAVFSAVPVVTLTTVTQLGQATAQVWTTATTSGVTVQSYIGGSAASCYVNIMAE